jgi:hypothetical protein
MKITQNLSSSENLKTLSLYKPNFQTRNSNPNKIPFKRKNNRKKTKNQAFLGQSSNSKGQKTAKSKKSMISLH